jgi:hypothetical protein
MIQRLLFYFAVVFVIVLLATSFNRFVIDKKKTVSEVIDETSNFIQTKVAEEQKSELKAEASREIAEDSQAGITPAFKKWFRDEASQVNSTQLDTRAKEEELRKTAKSFTASQVEFLKKTMTDASSSQQEKILSVYLLSMGGEAAMGSLSEVASRPLNTKPADAHSVQETLNNQERAHAITAIDAIAESGLPLSARIDELRKIISKQQDAAVKNYAQRKQSELQSEL